MITFPPPPLFVRSRVIHATLVIRKSRGSVQFIVQFRGQLLARPLVSMQSTAASFPSLGVVYSTSQADERRQFPLSPRLFPAP